MKAGFTLVEVIIALVILQIGLLGSVTTVALATRTLTDASRVERTTATLEGVLDSLVREPEIVAASRADGPRRIHWGVRGDIVVVGFEHPDGRPDSIEARAFQAWYRVP